MGALRETGAPFFFGGRNGVALPLAQFAGHTRSEGEGVDYIGWVKENWGAIYGIGALISGLLTAIVAFFGVWLFAAVKYQLGGLVLGWLPGAIASIVLGAIVGLGWPILVPAILWLASILVPAMADEYSRG